METRDTFFRIITPGHLYYASAIFAIATAVLVAAIYFFLYTRKRKFRTRHGILETLNEWIGEMMVEKTAPEIHVSARLTKFLKKESNRQFIILSLINIKKNLTGSATDTTIYIYEKLGLQKDSEKKLRSFAWHRKARGIYELYMMNQSQHHAAIFAYTNSPNEYVRMEAQTAIVGFAGFDGLTFLDHLIHPLHEWQQIKLLEQLGATDVESMPQLQVWLESPNDYVVQFALKLADIYQQFHLHDIVVKCLSNPNEKIRYQAIKTLGRIPNNMTPQVFKQQCFGETPQNKLEIIRQLATIASNDDLDFLTDLLQEKDQSVIIEAGRAIIRNSWSNWAILEKYLPSPSIYRQLKQEFS